MIGGIGRIGGIGWIGRVGGQIQRLPCRWLRSPAPEAQKIIGGMASVQIIGARDLPNSIQDVNKTKPAGLIPDGLTRRSDGEFRVPPRES